MSILKQQFTTIFSLSFCRIPEQKVHKISKETDVELLCKAIYENGEQYMDGTGAINFMDLKLVSAKIHSSEDCVHFHILLSYKFFARIFPFWVFAGLARKIQKFVNEYRGPKSDGNANFGNSSEPSEIVIHIFFY